MLIFHKSHFYLLLLLPDTDILRYFQIITCDSVVVIFVACSHTFVSRSVTSLGCENFSLLDALHAVA
jgi:hypothetical protein